MHLLILFNGCVLDDDGNVKTCDNGFEGEPFITVKNNTINTVRAIIPELSQVPFELDIERQVEARLPVDMNSKSFTFILVDSFRRDTLTLKYELGIEHVSSGPRVKFVTAHFQGTPDVRYALASKRLAELSSPNNLSTELNCGRFHPLVINE